MNHRYRAAAQGTLALLLLLANAPSAWAGTGGVAGRVLKQSDNTPLPGAHIQIGNKTATADSSGHYALTGIAAGPAQITASATGFQSAAVGIRAVAGTTTTAPDLKLTVASVVTLTGTVTRSDSGAAVAGATVKIAALALTTTTNASGHYTLSPLRAGTLRVDFTAHNYTAVTRNVLVGTGNPAPLNLALVYTGPPPPQATVAWNGANVYLSGANYAWNLYSEDFGGRTTNWAQMKADFAQMHTQGVRIARWWVFGDGRRAPLFAPDGTVSGLPNTLSANLERALKIASDYHIGLLLTVMDSGMWDDASVLPNGLTAGGHSGMVRNDTVRQSFLDNALKPLVQTVAASRNAGALLGYDIVSEPENQMAYWSVGGAQLETEAVQAFVRQCAETIHQYGGGAYATLGALMPGSVGDWNGLGLDFYQIHYYPWMDAADPAGSGLPNAADLHLDKPCIVGEFPTAAASYNLTDTAPLTAQWYLDTIYSKGYAGALAWSLRVQDDNSRWQNFAPLFTIWTRRYSDFIGP